MPSPTHFPTPMPPSGQEKEAFASLAGLSAQAAILQPIHWLIMVVAAAAVGAMAGLNRVERIEQAIDRLTVIVCQDKPADSHCNNWRAR